SRPTIATLSGCEESWANTLPPLPTMNTRQINIQKVRRIFPPKPLSLCGRFAGSAYPSPVLFFKIDPLGLRTKITAPIEDVDQCSRLRNIKINLAEVGDAQIVAIRRLHVRGGVHGSARGPEL